MLAGSSGGSALGAGRDVVGGGVVVGGGGGVVVVGGRVVVGGGHGGPGVGGGPGMGGGRGVATATPAMSCRSAVPPSTSPITAPPIRNATSATKMLRIQSSPSAHDRLVPQ